ncbi:MAG: HAMP domain-containing sensor histidine kinase [Bacteroidia bacterium]
MVRQNLTLITFIVSIALIALVAVQLFWINNAVQLKKDEFRRDVYESLINVVDKLEKLTNTEKIKKKIKLYKHGIAQRTPGSNLTKESIKVKILEEISIDSNGVITSSIKERQYDGDSINNMIDFPMEFGDKGSDYDKLKSELVEKRAEMFSDLFDELISINVYKEYKPQIDTLVLDSLLKNEFHQKGIAASYTSKVHPPQKEDSLLFESLHQGPDKPSHPRRRRLINVDPDKHIFRVNLSPNNIFVVPMYLTLQFPDEQNYLLRTMWATLSISGIIILALVIAFFYTINTIRKQKKYTEIKNDFISNMTHEFKTPISTIALASEMLMDSSISKTPEKLTRFTNMIREENKRLGVLVESILQTAVLDKGDFKLQRTDFDLNELIQSSVEKIYLQIEQKQGKLITQLNAKEAMIWADKVHITNIVLNLLDNAIKYSKEKPDITISTQNINNGILLAVKDSGIGISKENVKKIFDQFYRVSTGNVHDIKGFGLGLSYVKAIVVKHGGQITIDSEINKGSTFNVFIPFKIENLT